MLKSLRETSQTDGNEGMGEFVRLVEDRYGDARQTEDGGEAMDTT
jgi:hypothetical protein